MIKKTLLILMIAAVALTANAGGKWRNNADQLQARARNRA